LEFLLFLNREINLVSFDNKLFFLYILRLLKNFLNLSCIFKLVINLVFFFFNSNIIQLAMNKLRNCLKNLKSQDIFGKPITLTMNQDDTYKTVFGGLISISLKIFFFLFIIFSLYQLFTLKNFSSLRYDINLGATYGALELNENIMNFAFMFDASILNNWTNPFVNISFLHVIQFRNSTLTYKTKQNLQLKPCEPSDFPGLENEFQELGLNQGLCLMPNSNLSLQGNFQENVFSYFQISLSPCNDPSICQNNETVYETATSLGYFHIFFWNNYFYR